MAGASYLLSGINYWLGFPIRIGTRLLTGGFYIGGLPQNLSHYSILAIMIFLVDFEPQAHFFNLIFNLAGATPSIATHL